MLPARRMEAITDTLVRHGYVVVFVWVLAEQIGVPLPAVPFLLAAGALAGSGRLSLPLILVVAAIASLIGDTLWYWIGRLGDGRVLRWLCVISLEPDSCVRRTQDVFGRHGARSLLIAKFVPGYNTAAPPLAGIIRMPVTTFMLFTGLGGLIWAGVFAGAGWLFSAQLEAVASYATDLGAGALVIVAAGFAGYVGWKFVSRQRFLRRIRIARITPEELKAKLDAGEEMLLVDLRHRADFAAEPAIIPGALYLSTEDLEARHHEIPRERDIVLYCT
jgi:membrane protein DedA with SNARE-associated domain